MSDAIFNASGDVNGGSGRIASAWLGPGASAAPSMANILSAAGIMPTQTVERHLPAYTYSKPAPVDYQKIADDAKAAQQSLLGFKDQSELENYIKEQIAAQGPKQASAPPPWYAIDYTRTSSRNSTGPGGNGY